MFCESKQRGEHLSGGAVAPQRGQVGEQNRWRQRQMRDGVGRGWGAVGWSPVCKVIADTP